MLNVHKVLEGELALVGQSVQINSVGDLGARRLNVDHPEILGQSSNITK